MPWDQTTPLGYFGEIGFFIVNIELFWSISGEMFLFFIFLCENNFTFAEMYASFIDEFDQSEGMQEKCDLIRKSVDFHNDVKKY